MLKIGVTGGIGSGKSTVCKLFQLLGVPVYSADVEAKKILQEDTLVKEEVINLFGNIIVDETGTIDRKKIADIVFIDKKKLENLNSIIHPVVKRHFYEWLKNQTAPYVLKEAAILFESGTYRELDQIITITAPVDIRIKRVMERDVVSKESVEQRIKQQMSDEEKIRLSQFVIMNNEEELIIPQVLKIHQQLIQKSQE